MNGLTQLLSMFQQGAGELPGLLPEDVLPNQPQQPQGGVGETIDVTGARTRNPQDQYLVPDEGPRAPLPSLNNNEDIQRSIDAAKNAPERSGKFGIKGTLRDVLGILGDGFLVQSGNKAVYAPQIEREQRANGMAGFTRNAGNAMERLAGMGFTDEAAALNQVTGQQDYQAGQLANQQATSQATAANQASIQQDRAIKLMGQGAAAIAQNPALYATLGPILQKIAGDSGLSDMYQFPDPNDPATPPGLYQGYATAGTPSSTVQNIQAQAPYKERAADNADRRAATGEYNAESGRIRANKAGAARNPPTPTEAGETARIRSKINRGETLDAGDQATWDKYLSGGKGSQRRPAPAGVAPVRRFERVK